MALTQRGEAREDVSPWTPMIDTFADPGALGSLLAARPRWGWAYAVFVVWTVLAMIVAGMREAVLPALVAISVMLLLEAVVATGILALFNEPTPFRFVWAVYVHSALIGSAVFYTIIAAIVLLARHATAAPETLMPNLGWLAPSAQYKGFLTSVDPVSLWATSVVAVALGRGGIAGYVAAFGQYLIWMIVFGGLLAQR